MLEQKDYKQIKKIFNEEGKKLFKFETKELETRLSNKIDAQGKDLETRLSNKIDKQGKELEKNIVMQLSEVIEDNIIPVMEEIKKDIARLPDKAYLSDKLADLEGSVIVRQKKENKRINL